MHNVFTYYGDNKPVWEPRIDPAPRLTLDYLSNGAVVIDNVLTDKQVAGLCVEFETQKKYPVGINGYSNSEENAGSYRAMSWSESIAILIGDTLSGVLPREHSRDFITDTRIKDVDFTHYFEPYSTPWVRFMKYTSGGMHVPHYDASYHQPEEIYRTLYSWALYLNTVPKNQRGAFQFVDDSKSAHRHDYSDWTRMANEDEILESIQPVQGRLLVFPHWLCHQVQEFTSSVFCNHRTICRGDASYLYEN